MAHSKQVMTQVHGPELVRRGPALCGNKGEKPERIYQHVLAHLGGYTSAKDDKDHGTLPLGYGGAAPTPAAAAEAVPVPAAAAAPAAVTPAAAAAAAMDWGQAADEGLQWRRGRRPGRCRAVGRRSGGQAETVAAEARNAQPVRRGAVVAAVRRGAAVAYAALRCRALFRVVLAL